MIAASGPLQYDAEAMNREEHLRRIFQAAVRAVEPGGLLGRGLRLQGDQLEVLGREPPLRLDLKRFERLVVLGAGKAAAAMAAALENLLGARIDEGLVVVKDGYGAPLQRVRCLEAGHPLPDERGLAAAAELERLATRAGPRSLALVLVSGGGSALLPAPIPPLSLADKQAVTRALLASGAQIGEVNCLRKHLSRLKGGRLIGLLGGAEVLALILSDVPGDGLESIASGLTVPDPGTYAEALGIARKYGLELPAAARVALERGLRGELPESPKPGDPRFERVHNVLIGTNLTGLEAARREAEALGYAPLLLSSRIVGEAREVGKVYAAIALEQRRFRGLASGRLPASGRLGTCILGGGETTVRVSGRGRGGRNQECALSFLEELAGTGPAAGELHFLAASSDGTDGPTDAAGAFASLDLLQKSRRLGLEPAEFLARNDSYAFFDRIGGLLRTGPTNTNVCDFQICLVGNSGEGT
jgi:glycerate 2-kinase